MTERIYNDLWTFAKAHKDYRCDNPYGTVPVGILNLYQQEAPAPLELKTAADVEEALECIRNALKYAF